MSNVIYDFEAITPNHILICYQNNENSFANPTDYIKGLQKIVKLCSAAQTCFETVGELIIY